MQRYRFHRAIFLFCLYVGIASIPFLRAVLSICMIALTINWLLEGHFRTKRKRFLANPGIGLMGSFYLAGLLGTLYSQDTAEALKYLRVSLPILVIPLVVGTSEQLKLWHIKTMLYLLYTSVLVNLAVSLMLFAGLLPYEVHNFREYAFFCSHIRLSLYIDVGIFSGLYLLRYHSKNLVKAMRIAILGFITILTLYLFFLKSLSGILILFLLTGLILLKAGLQRPGALRYLSAALLIGLPLGGFWTLRTLYVKNFQSPPPKKAKLPEATANGRPYKHYPQRHQMENGHYVWIKIQPKELKQAWNARSDIPYSGKDKKGQNLYSTLIRYLAAHNLPRDSVGVSKLTRADVRAIEQGYTNPIFLSQLSLYPRIYSILQEIYNYNHTGYPHGTLTTRLEAYMAAWYIFRKHPLLGTGPGDDRQAYKNYYQNQEKPHLGIYGHNQYLLYLVMLGLMGLIWFLAAFPGAWLVQRGYKNPAATVVLLILLISMLSEDTLRSQRSIALFLYAYSISLFHMQHMHRP